MLEVKILIIYLIFSSHRRCCSIGGKQQHFSEPVSRLNLEVISRLYYDYNLSLFSAMLLSFSKFHWTLKKNKVLVFT